jgi:SNW domain-containing protein 1
MPLSGDMTLAVVSQQSTPSQNTNNAQTSSTNKTQRAPAYEQRCRAAAELSKLTPEQRKQNNRKLFVPRSLDDFDDGGAFPEIHVAQYPRHMGNPHLKKQGTTGGSHINSSSRAIVNVEVDRDGEISYDMIVKGGTNSDKKVFSRHEDLIGGPPKEEDIALPDEETEEEVVQRTQLALQKLLASKTALDKPSGSAMVNAETSKNIEEKTQFIKYTPRPDAPGYNPAAAQRVIQMVPAQVDPMMPPKHKHVKAPRGPAEDPVPVLHAPPQKLTKEERDKWNVPACISNWKNTRGYTIPLDKRLAADGRGLREHTINSNFATLSESLYVAERHARNEVRMRSQVQKKLVLQEKDQREEELRQLANQARLERSGMASSNTAAAVSKPLGGEDDTDVDDDEIHVSDASDDERGARRRHEKYREDDDDRHDETDEQVAARQREKLRMERKRERERELRMENNMELKKKKLEEDRDVSEKIALGVHTGSGGLAVGQVDARLYNQSAGMDSGFGAEDEYNTYSAPLFDRQGVSSASIYRPTRGETEYNADESYDKLVEGATTKFQPGKGFAGAEGGTGMSAGPRSAPVQFERDKK